MEVHKVLRLPRNLHMEVHKALCLPRNLHMEVHKVLCLPRNLHMELHKVLRRPRNLHMEVHKVLCLPRHLHVKKQVKTLITIEERTGDHRRQPPTTADNATARASNGAWRFTKGRPANRNLLGPSNLAGKAFFNSRPRIFPAKKSALGPHIRGKEETGSL